MSVIQTKYLGPTNTRGSRVKVTRRWGYATQSKIFPYRDRFNDLQAHTWAFREALKAWGDTGHSIRDNPTCYVYGGSLDGRGYTFCLKPFRDVGDVLSAIAANEEE